ncbi:MAG: penicillin-binding transpeptidase domain-containing protein, partial [Planctomycetota bacterium]
MHRLLGLTPAERRALRSRLREDDAEGGRTFLELAGAVTNQRTEDVRAELEARVLAADERLARLAQLVEWEDGEDRLTTLSAGDRLVELIEEQRRAVDDDAANALFEMAAGFRPSRLDARNLARLELDWLRASLDWDGFRFEQWLESAGGAFDREVSAWLAPHTIARSKIRGADAGAAPADRLVSAVAHAFRADPESWERQRAAPQDWRAVDELVVLTSMPARMSGWTREARELARAPLFPFQAPALRESLLEGDALVEAAFAGTLGAEPRATAGFLVNLAADASEWDPEDEPATAAVLRAHHARLQQRVAELFDVLAAEEGGEEGGPIRFVEAALEKAEETLPYILRDRGGRARVVGGRPPMELVLLVGRYAEEFAGFSVRTRTDRRAVALGPDGVPLARQLIGNVRTPRLVDLLRQRPMDEELRALQKKLVLPDEDRARILGLMDEAFRDGEKIGNSGLESMLNRELSGEDGYIEWHGLQDRVQGNRAPIYRGARDGEDVRLTLDQDIQFAAEEVLLRPVFPRDDKGADRSWEDHPVGAIVLARTNGDILAAASVPQRKGDFVPDQTDGQRLSNIDRVLRRPTFQPPGSVVKPLLSVYALDHLGLDPELALCYCDYNQPRLGGDLRNVKHAGWGAVNCNSRAGHSGRFAGRSLRMEEAIRVSCNTYFAALAEKYFGREDMRKAYRLYGFGRATGVRFDDGGRRGGLLEESAFNPRSPLADGREGPLAPQDIQRIGNGLSGVDANVAQVARA